jgi:hypothetical protein
MHSIAIYKIIRSRHARRIFPTEITIKEGSRPRIARRNGFAKAQSEWETSAFLVS